MNIGDSIKYYRKLKNLTQKDLAEILGSTIEELFLGDD